MPGPPSSETYDSRLPYDHARIGAAAIYCSDGRVGDHFDDFLQHGLGLPRYDRVALPGGAARLARNARTHLEARGVLDELRFLVEAHQLRRVVLIAHEGCAFYHVRLRMEGAHMEHAQRSDLAWAAAYARRIEGLTDVQAYFARLANGGVRFEPVEV